MHVIPVIPAILLLLPLAAAAGAGDRAPVLEWEVVSRRAHDPTAFTQGLLLDADGRLFESTGLRGASTVREVDPISGRVLRSRSLDGSLFGEGLELVGEELIQLTYTSQVALRWGRETFELIDTHPYEGQGWGLCYDGDRLVMSDGSPTLSFRDASTFELLGSQMVTFEGSPLIYLNELECVDDAVWANIWKSDVIVRIDPDEGEVTGVLDLGDVVDPRPADVDADAVLNGIAWDETAGTFLVTGKYWPELVEIRVLEPETDAATEPEATPAS